MSLIHMDGLLVSAPDVTFGPTLFSLNYAVCAFEGIRCYDTVKGRSVFRLRDHLRRYVETCRYLGLESPNLTESALYDATMELILSSTPGNLYIRPIAFIDEGIMSLHDHPPVRSCIFALPFKPLLGVKTITIGIASHSRSTDTISQKISRNYFDSYMGLKHKGEDEDDLLFLDRHDLVTETSAHNVFFVLPSGAVVTPRTTHCLPGITRNTVIELLGRRDVHVEERDIDLGEIGSFNAMFTTSTATEIRIVKEIKGQKLELKNLTVDQLVQDFRDCVEGQSEYRRDWNDYVHS